MVRKTKRSFGKKYNKKTHKMVRRKYTGGLTPKNTKISKGIFKNKTGNFGFTSKPMPIEDESFGFPSSPTKITVRCNPNDTECEEMERLKRLKKIADDKKTPPRKKSSDIKDYESFKRNRKAAKENYQAYKDADDMKWKKALGKKALDPVNLNEKTIDYYLSKKN